MGTAGDRQGYGTAAAVSVRRLLDLLGFAARAGQVVTGTEAVRGAVRDEKLRRVILASDAAPTQRKKLEPLLKARGVPYHVIFTQAELGAAMGRAPVSAVGLGDANFARRAGELIASIPTRRGDVPVRGTSQQE